MRRLITQLLTRHIYTSEALFKNIYSHNVSGARSLVAYLKKYNPEALREVLKSHQENGITPLCYSFIRVRNQGHYKTAIALLEAGAEPHGRLAEEFNGRVVMHDAIAHRRLPDIRLLLWYDPDNYLTIEDPKTGLTIQSLLAKWNREEPFFAIFEGRPVASDIEKNVADTTRLAQQRFDLIQAADNHLSTNNYAAAIECYLELNTLCKRYAEMEGATLYPVFYDNNIRTRQIKFYQNYGQRYLQSAYQTCQQWLTAFKNPASPNREQISTYKKALNQAIVICQQLKKPREEARYRRQLEQATGLELSPSSARITISRAEAMSPTRASSGALFVPPRSGIATMPREEGEDPLPYSRNG